MSRRILSISLILLATQLMWGQKKRVAVLDFEYGTVQSGVAAIFGQNVDIGKGISDLLVEQLVKDGTYSVIERKALAKLLAEQNLSNSDRADSTSAAKIGKILGVDAIIIGSITQFGRDDRNVGVGGALGGFGSKYGLGKLGMKTAKAVVGISARTVLVETGEIMAVARGMGESKRKGTDMLGGGASGGTGGAGMVDMSSSNFSNTIIGEATAEAVAALRTDLVAGSTKIPTRTIPVNGLIADVAGNTLILNVGARAGVKVGQTLQVVSGGREIRDPATGRVLRRIGNNVGTVTITEVDEQSSVGTYSGAGKPKVGDQAVSPGK